MMRFELKAYTCPIFSADSADKVLTEVLTD